MLDTDLLKKLKRFDKRLNRVEVKPPGSGTTPATPDAPTGLTLTTTTASSDCPPSATIEATWSAGASGADFYIIEYSTDSGFADDQTGAIISVDTDALITGLALATTYYVHVAAVLTGVVSAWSSPAVSITSASGNPVATIYVPTWGTFSSNDGVWKYDTDTATWVRLSSGLPTGKYWWNIAADPLNPDNLAMVGDSSASIGDLPTSGGNVVMQDGSTAILWVSQDAGTTWTSLALPVPGGSNTPYRMISVPHVEWSDTDSGKITIVFRAASGASWFFARWDGTIAGGMTGTIDGGQVVDVLGWCQGLTGEVVTLSEYKKGYFAAGSTTWTQVTNSAPGTIRYPFLDTIPATRQTLLIGNDNTPANTNLKGSSNYTTTDYTNIGSTTGAHVTVSVAKGYVTGGSQVVEITDPFGSPSASNVTSALSAPLYTGYVRAARQSRDTVYTVAARILASSPDTGGKDVWYYDGAAWTRITGPSAGTSTNYSNTLEVTYTAAGGACVGCPPAAHADNHCADGCDPIDISCLDGQITTAQIADDAVTFAKMQNITTDRLLGRDTAGTGDVEQLTVSGGLEFTGSGGMQRSALTGDATASAGSNATSVVKLQGRTLASTAPTNGQAIVWNNGASQWEPGSASGSPTGSAGGDLSGTYPNPTVAKIQGNAVQSAAPADADRLRWSAGNSRWEPSAKIWEPLTNGDVTTPELIFAGGDVIMCEV